MGGNEVLVADIQIARVLQVNDASYISNLVRHRLKGSFSLC